MKPRHAFLILALGLAGCSSFSKSSELNLYKVHVGETSGEMLKDLGEPGSKDVASGGVEKWYYDIYSQDNRKTYPYTAVFEGGVLKQWNFDTARNVVRDVRKPSSQRLPY